MKTSLAIFGAFTALNTLVAFVMIWSGFRFDKPELIEWSRWLYLEVHSSSYLALGLMLLFDLSFYIRKRIKRA